MVQHDGRRPATVVALIAVQGSPPTSPVASGRDQLDPIWADLAGRPLLWHSVQRLREAGVHGVVLVADPSQSDRVRSLARDPALGGSVTVVIADDRTAGMRAALAASAGGTSPAAVALVHDPTRAFAPVALIRRVIDAVVAGAAAVLPVLPVVDTIRSIGADGQASAIVDRDTLRIVQSPQAFDADVLRQAYDGAPGKDEAALVLAIGHRLTTVPGHADAVRVATAGDLDHARRTLGRAASRPPPDPHAPEHRHG